MKNLLVLATVGLVLVSCAASRINITAEIPESQEVSISIETKNTDNQL